MTAIPTGVAIFNYQMQNDSFDRVLFNEAAISLFHIQKNKINNPTIVEEEKSFANIISEGSSIDGAILKNIFNEIKIEKESNINIAEQYPKNEQV